VTPSSAAARTFRAFLTGVVALVGLATLVGLLDRVWWVFEAADVFRLQYLVVLAAAGLVGLTVRRPRLAALAVVLAAVNVAILGVPVTPHASAAPGPVSGRLRVVAANVEVGNTDFAAVGRLVARTHPDLFGVTELTPVMARHLAEELPAYRTRVLDIRSDAYGIGVYSRRPLLSAKVVRFPADGPPTVVVRVRVAGKPVSVVVTHVHTPFAGSIHVRHLDALAAAARWKLGRRVVICGDFNTPPWSGPLRDFATDARVHDLYGTNAWAAYSWPTWGSALRIPVDNCFVNSGVVVTGHHDGPNDGSDHRPLVVDIGISR
jgi:endonuclease/exonuclease/phosphatase (EEP) superfamily protein YafD